MRQMEEVLNSARVASSYEEGVQGIGTTTIVLTLVSIVGLGFGFLKEVVIANYFGTQAAADSFYAVTYYVQIFNQLAFTGLASAAIVPFLSQYISTHRDEVGWSCLAALGFWVTLSMLLVTGLVFLFMPRLVDWLLPKFSPAQKAMTIKLGYVMFPAVVFVSLSGITLGILYSYQKFYTARLAQIAFNSAIMIATFGLVSKFGMYSAALGFLLGSIVYLGIQIFSLHKNIAYRLHLDNLFPKGLKYLLRLSIPVFVTVLLANIIGIVERYIASGLTRGGISALNYSFRICGLVSMFGISLSTVVYPKMSLSAAKDDNKELERILTEGLRLGLFLLIPGAFFILFYRSLLISLLFERGAFDSTSLKLTSDVLQWYVPVIVLGFVNGLLLRVLYAIHKPFYTIIVTSATVGVTVAADFLLTHFFDYEGIAMGYALGTICSVVVGCAILKRVKGIFLGKLIAKYAGRVLLPSAGALVSIWSMGTFLIGPNYPNGGRVGELAIGLLFYVVAFIAFSKIARIREVDLIFSRLRTPR